MTQQREEREVRGEVINRSPDALKDLIQPPFSKYWVIIPYAAFLIYAIIILCVYWPFRVEDRDLAFTLLVVLGIALIGLPTVMLDVRNKNHGASLALAFFMALILSVCTGILPIDKALTAIISKWTS
jgi:multisubunit Na+/H+ antiporter MnhB subunit